MNFMELPEPAWHPNGKMDPDAQKIAGEFADELIELGALIDPPPDMEVKLNVPFLRSQRQANLASTASFAT